MKLYNKLKRFARYIQENGLPEKGLRFYEEIVCDIINEMNEYENSLQVLNGLVQDLRYRKRGSEYDIEHYGRVMLILNILGMVEGETNIISEQTIDFILKHKSELKRQLTVNDLKNINRMVMLNGEVKDFRELKEKTKLILSGTE